MHDAADRTDAPGRHVSEEDLRTANLLGALALTLTDRAWASLEDDSGVAGSDAAALISLANYAEGRSIDTLRAALGLSQPGTVRLVDRLAARGLVERRRSERDARAVALRLTPEGRRAAELALEGRATATIAALESLTAGERRALTRLLEKMLTAATTDAASSRRICRLCDGDACGHPGRCPVTQAVT
jgi:MarR family transcriptional repressor of emrRAB